MSELGRLFIGKRISALLVLCCGIQSCHVFFCASTAVWERKYKGSVSPKPLRSSFDTRERSQPKPRREYRASVSSLWSQWIMVHGRSSLENPSIQSRIVIALRFFFCSLDTLSSHSVSGGSHVFQSSLRVCHLRSMCHLRCLLVTVHSSQLSVHSVSWDFPDLRQRAFSQCFLRFLEPLVLSTKSDF